MIAQSTAPKINWAWSFGYLPLRQKPIRHADPYYRLLPYTPEHVNLYLDASLCLQYLYPPGFSGKINQNLVVASRKASFRAPL